METEFSNIVTRLTVVGENNHNISSNNTSLTGSISFIDKNGNVIVCDNQPILPKFYNISPLEFSYWNANGEKTNVSIPGGKYSINEYVTIFNKAQKGISLSYNRSSFQLNLNGNNLNVFDSVKITSMLLCFNY